MDYRNQAFARIFQDLLDLGWDLPAKHAESLTRCLETEDRTLEQEFLVTRYLRDMGYGVPESR